MSIPSYNLIPDSDIDPESPITSSLMFRLRDNWMSLFGIDTTDPAPAIKLPPSTQEQGQFSWHTATGGSGATVTSAESILSVITDDVEDWSLGQPYSAPYDTGNSVRVYLASHFCTWHDNGAASIIAAWVGLAGVSVIYSSGNPTGVQIHWVQEDSPASGTATITLANTFQTVRNSGGIHVQAKARSDGTNVYIQFRLIASAPYKPVINVPLVRKSFRSKAAP